MLDLFETMTYILFSPHLGVGGLVGKEGGLCRDGCVSAAMVT